MVICTYNESTFISDCVWSLLACDDPNFEVIVVDDGSSDDTPEVMQRFDHDARVRYIRQTNRGQAGAFNRGVAEARGELIGLADGDDFSYPHKLRMIRWWFDIFQLWDQRVILRHPLLRLADAPQVDASQRTPNYATMTGAAEFGSRDVMLLSSAEDTRAHVRCYGFWPYCGGVSSSTMITRALADAVFPLPEFTRHFGDLFPVLGGCLLGDLYATPLALGAYRIHGRNHSLTAGRQTVEFWEGIEAWLNERLARDGQDVRVDFFHSSQGVAYLVEQGQTWSALRSAGARAFQRRDRRSAKLAAKTAVLTLAQALGVLDRLLRTERF